jgi:hypothetical protein
MPPPRPTPDSARLSELCCECGLCCDGSLFRFLPADPAELERYAALGLPTVIQSGRPAMPLPCLRLADRCCTVYADRPTGCRSYRCRLSHRLGAGEVTMVQALTAVHEAQARIAVLGRHWPEPGPLVQSATAAALAGDPRMHGPALAALASVQAWLDDAIHWP